MNVSKPVHTVGLLPTERQSGCPFDPPKELLEAYIFDFDEGLYGRTIEVSLHHYLREEMRFDDVQALAARMREDEAEARRLLLP